MKTIITGGALKIQLIFKGEDRVLDLKQSNKHNYGVLIAIDEGKDWLDDFF